MHKAKKDALIIRANCWIMVLHNGRAMEQATISTNEMWLLMEEVATNKEGRGVVTTPSNMRDKHWPVGLLLCQHFPTSMPTFFGSGGELRL